MIISAIDDTPMPDRDDLRDAMAGVFGADGIRLLETKPGRSAQFRVEITASTGSPFMISKLNDGSLTVDGTPAQNATVAAAVRAALPAEFPRVIAFDPDGGVFVDLAPGITAERIATGWRDISEGGF